MDHLELRVGGIHGRSSIERIVRARAKKLERHAPGVTSMHVAVERPQAHLNQGSGYRVRIEVRLAGADPFVVCREPSEGGVNDGLRQVLNEAFAAADRKARELTRTMRDEVKGHPKQEVAGIVIELHPDYGLVFSKDGRKIYFHAHSVLGVDFEDLREGMGVAFTVEDGEEGPQASTLRVVDRRGRPGRLDELMR